MKKHIWLTVCILFVMIMPVAAQGDGLLETFDDPALPGWELVDASVQDGVLHVEKSGYAHLDGEWSDFALSLRVRFAPQDEITIRYHVSEAEAYHLVSGNYLGLFRYKENSGRRISPDRVGFENSGDWMQIDIRVVDNMHEVKIDGEFAFVLTETDPLPPGGFMLGWTAFQDKSEFDDFHLMLGETIPPLSQGAEDYFALVEWAENADHTLYDTVLTETAATYIPEIFTLGIDTDTPGVIHYRQRLTSMAGAYSFVGIDRYATPERAQVAFDKLAEKESSTCEEFHGLPACWGRRTWVDSGNHHRDVRWITWHHAEHIFFVNWEYASLYAGEAYDPLPLADMLFETGIAYGLLPDSAAD